MNATEEFGNSFAAVHDFYYKKLRKIANNPVNDPVLAEKRLQLSFVTMNHEFNTLETLTEDGFMSWAEHVIKETLHEMRSLDESKIDELTLEYHVITCATHNAESDFYNDSFSVLYKTFYKPIFFISKKILYSHHDSEDCAQLVIKKINRSFHTLRNRTLVGFISWANMITKRTAINIKKKRKNNEISTDEPFSNSQGDMRTIIDLLRAKQKSSVYARLDMEELIDAIFNIISNFNNKKRTDIFLLYWRDGYKYKEIAKKLNISLAAVSIQILRAKRNIIKGLKDTKFSIEDVKELLKIIEKERKNH